MNNTRPNVVFVLTDDQGYPTLGCHGHPFIQTPNVDEFYTDSVRFDQFHSGTTCAPTRSGLMAGHYCNSTGVWHTIGGRSLLRRDEWSIADAMREAGYRTGMFGKWHLGDGYPYRPQDRGFETVVCHGGGGISQQPDWWGNDYFDDTYMVDGKPQAFKGYCTDVFFREALQFIETHKDEPFFCYIATNAPHGPFNVDPQYRDLYMDKPGGEQYARFLGMITNIDENFGRVRDRLSQLGLEDNTILVFMSDNGQTGVGGCTDMYNAGMRGLKGSEYDGGHRIPCLVRWPNGEIDGGRTVSELTSYVDFMPTILDLCQVPVPPERTFHGESLVPIMRDAELDNHWQERVVVTDTQRVAHPVKWRKSCVMKSKWRLVNRTELYNIETDPGQTTNIADQHPGLVQELRETYDQWWNLCARQMQDDIPISLGADAQEIAELRTHDLRNETCDVVWNQGQVRAGQNCVGYWEIDVETAGAYEFELRRWPREAGHTVAGGIDGHDVSFDRTGIAPGAENMYSGGKAMGFQTAFLNVSGMPQQSVTVSPEDTCARLTVTLDPGPRHVRAYFADAAGWTLCSAYYVYVRRIPPV